MTATDELRALLDERGVAHSDHYFKTTWRDGNGILHLADASMADGFLVVDMLTPAQAIELTLWRGECENASGYPMAFECSSCGCMVSGGDEMGHNSTHGAFNYCPSCGKKVKR